MPRLASAATRPPGFAISIMPTAGFLAAAAALERACGEIARTGNTAEGTERYDFAELWRLVGFEEVWAFEKRYG